MRCRGLSLVEIVVSLSLSLCILFAVAAAATGHLGTRQGLGRTLAGSVASEVLDSIRTMEPQQVRAGFFDGRIPARPIQGFPPLPYPRAERTTTVAGSTAHWLFDITVSSTALDGLAGLHRIECTVFWTLRGQPQTLSLTTFVGQ